MKVKVLEDGRNYRIPVLVRVKVGDGYKDLESFRLRFYRSLGLSI